VIRVTGTGSAVHLLPVVGDGMTFVQVSYAQDGRRLTDDRLADVIRIHAPRLAVRRPRASDSGSR